MARAPHKATKSAPSPTIDELLGQLLTDCGCTCVVAKLDSEIRQAIRTLKESKSGPAVGSADDSVIPGLVHCDQPFGWSSGVESHH